MGYGAPQVANMILRNKFLHLYGIIACQKHEQCDHAKLQLRENIYIYTYVKYDLRYFLARCSPAAECFFSHFRPRGQLACHGYITKHVWLSTKLRGGARRIKRRLAGSICEGIAFRLPETSRSLGTPQQTVLQVLTF